MKLKHLLLLLMTVVSFSTTRAADDTTVVPTNWTKVAFNSDFRYSQWVINSRLGDFYGNSTQMGFTQYDGNGNIVGSAKTSKFDYVPGLVAKATLEARDLYKDFDWSKPWFYTVLNYGKAYTYTAKSASEQERKGLEGLTLDNMNAAKIYFGIAADALATSSDKTLSEGQIAGIIKDMKLYNENWAIGGANSTNKLGDAVAGGWFHKPEYVDQMWGDGLYMGSALLAQIINNKGTSANVTDNDWDLITKQFRISWQYMYNETNGLLWHAFTANRTTAKDAGWEGITADGSTYHSAAHWGRACGWYFLALVDVLEQMQIQIKAGKLQEADANYNELKNYVNLLAEGLASCQDDSGCWYQVLDEKVNHLAGNYLESSCTAIFTAAYLKGARLDLFGDKKNDYIAVAEKAYKGFVNNFMMRDANGDAQLIHCCASAGLGGSNKRSGSRDYYITGSDVTQRNTYTEGKVLGGFILAATEYERIHANEKPVLLTLDLQPECKLDGKTALEVAVNGNGNETYQWYEKTNGAIPGAQSATFTPTNNGIYYCAITVPATSSSAKGRIAARAAGYTLTSSETNVTVTAETGDGTSSTATISWRDMALNSHNATTIAGIVTPEQFSSYLTGKKGRVSGLEPAGSKDIATGSIKTRYYRYSGFAEAENTNVYFEYSYNVLGAFTPTKLSVDWAPSGSDNVVFNVYGVKADGTTKKLTGAPQKGSSTVIQTAVMTFSDSDVQDEFTAIRIVPFGSNAKSFILNNVVLEGTIDVLVKFEEGKGTWTDWRTLTVIHEPADAGKTDCTIGITPAAGVTCELGTLPDGVTASLSADGKTLTYTAPAAGTGFISIPLIATKDGKSYEYTVLVGTRVAPSYTSQYEYNKKAWTPAVDGTIALSKLINYEGDESNHVTISSGDAATLSADGKTLTAVKTGEITLSLPATDKYAAASMPIQVNIGTDVTTNGTNAYTIESGKVYSDGLAVNRENITMTFGNDGFWAKGTTFSAGQINPKPDDGKIPTSGTYYKFTPTKNGTLKATVYIGTDKNMLRPLYVSENGTAIEAKAGDLTVGKGETPDATEAYQGDVTFNVTANTDYYVYVNGSKMRILGFTFTPVESNSTATFKYESSDLTFTKVESEENTYAATIGVGAAKTGQDLSIDLSTAAGATVKLGETAVSGNTVTVKAPETVATPVTYTVTVTSADWTSTTIYKITVKLKQAIVLKYVLTDDSADATEDRKANAEWFWDKLANPSKAFDAKTTLVLHAYVADSNGNATTEISLPSGIKYESDMPSVATVDKDGKITPVGNSLGRAYIYATLENAEYEAKETRCAVYIRDGYTYNVTDADKNTKPALNEVRYITDKADKTLLRMKFGGWKYNNGKYIKPSVCQGSNWTSASDKDYVTDSWGDLATSGVTGIDGFTKGFPGATDACDESMKPSPHYNSTRYGWFKAPSDDNNNLYDPNNITETSPFTLPVRGAYMTFEPMVNGTLSVIIIQNGAWNTWDKDGTYNANGVEYTYKRGDIKKGEFRPHSFHVVNQRGLTLSQFSTKWSVDTRQTVTSQYYCDPDDDTHSSEGILSPNVADWPEFSDGRLTPGECADIVEAWKGGPRGNQKIVMLHDGSFLAVQKSIVKYTFHVTGQETYYLFSNFSKMGFCGANFTPDTEANTQPTATLELDDQVAYPKFEASNPTGTYEGNPLMPTFGGKDLPKINKHTFTVTKADGQTIGGVNVKGVQAPQFQKIVMNRTFKKGQWNTLCVPFNMTQRQVEEIFGVGTQLILLETAKIQGNVVKLHFLYHEIQNVLPGYPYLIKPTLTYKKGGLYENVSYSDGDAYTTETDVREVDATGNLTQFTVPVKHINPIITQQNIVCGDYSTTGTPGYCTANTKLDVAGTTHNVSVKYEDGDVFLSDGDGKLYVSTGASYGKGYRAYIKKISPAKVKSISMEYSGVQDGGESTPTEIKFTELAPEAAMTLGFRGVYNLSGQKVSETTEGLPAGIYIVNGQKMVVR